MEGGLSWLLIANCVLNAFLSYTAIMLNSVTIHAIRKTSSLPKTLKTLLLSLAVSDLWIGLFVQPFYVAILVMNLGQNSVLNIANPDTTHKVFFAISTILFSLVSFFGVMALSVDRFLAIYLHLRYQELVTHKRVVAVVILTWVLGAFLSLIWFCVQEKTIFSIYAILRAVCLIITAFLSFKIFVAVRRHAHQIQALQVQHVANGEIAKLLRSGVSTVYVYLVFLICYSPLLCVLISLLMNGVTPERTQVASFAITLCFLNSSLNPLIYSWKMRHIRHTVTNILRNVFSSQN